MMPTGGFSRVVKAVWFHAILALILHLMALLLFLFGGYAFGYRVGLLIIAFIVMSALMDLTIYLETREARLDIFEQPSRGKERHVWGVEAQGDTEREVFAYELKAVDLPPPPPDLLTRGADGKIRCPVCNSPLEENSKFCPSCGLRIRW